MQEQITLDEMLELAWNHPDEEQRISLGEELLLRAGTTVASGLTAALLALDSISGKDRLLSKDDRREMERILKCLSPDIGKGVEKLLKCINDIQPEPAQSKKPAQISLFNTYVHIALFCCFIAGVRSKKICTINPVLSAYWHHAFFISSFQT